MMTERLLEQISKETRSYDGNVSEASGGSTFSKRRGLSETGFSSVYKNNNNNTFSGEGESTQVVSGFLKSTQGKKSSFFNANCCGEGGN